ncbi:MAG: AmmeMemoRadiSam system radical SAM enzyme [Bacteroidales bacterium]
MGTYSECNGESCICLVCPHNCKLAPGSSGICRVRKNEGRGSIALTTCGLVSGFGSDPIEKKPLYHFYPGSTILSVGSYGCNLHCDFCQNWHISVGVARLSGKKMNPEQIVEDAIAIPGNAGIAFTYNEPVVWIEFMLDIAEKAKEAGLATVMVSNGYVNEKPLEDILKVIDAFNIDLKFFSDDSYRRYTGGTLAPVLRSLSQIASAGRHLEVTTLVIPGLNDTESEIREITGWIAAECGNETPLHLSRYHPAHKRTTPATPVDKLVDLHKTASETLSYVYIGNASTTGLSDTRCPRCGTIVTLRTGYTTEVRNITNSGKCSRCGHTIYRHLTSPA